ncbi:MAG TPA: hypothetical protein VNT28_00365 [Candidatus Limnocylindrales bacterium]|nr:hypothetical protein [Candidatus Limnocylindrales bacterium]
MAVGIDQVPHHGVIDGRACRGNHQQAVLLAKVIASDWLDPNAGTIELEVHVASTTQPDSLSKSTRDYHSSCLIYGSAHATIVPRGHPSGEHLTQGSVNVGIADAATAAQPVEDTT